MRQNYFSIFPFVKQRIAVILLFFVFGGFLAAQDYTIYPASLGNEIIPEIRPIFPEALLSSFIEAQEAWDMARPYWAPTEHEYMAIFANRPFESILLNNDLLLYYGHPLSRNMGILGRHPPADLKNMLIELAGEYREAGGRNMILGFYVIYGTVWPGGDIGIIRESVITEWIEWALENDMLVFLDHQIGRFNPIDQLRTLLPWLRYPNVHLALDPEWRTDKPMQEIGHMTAAEINQAQRIMEDYMVENNIPGERLLVIHQFNSVMIRNRADVRTNFSKVRLVLCMDGIGTPTMKRDTYDFVAQATNIPVKSFKLFYNLGIPGAGFDNPIMSPRDVLGLNPRPYVIMYQ